MTDTPASGNYIELTAEIVSAYVSNNTVPAGEIPSLISQVHAALARVSGKSGDAPSEPLRPAVSVKKSITPEYIVCLEDGKKFKSLKRHLRTQYNMTPEQYREKWALGADYPMVAPSYAAARSQLAKQMGLGQQRRRRANVATSSVERRDVGESACAPGPSLAAGDQPIGDAADNPSRHRERQCVFDRRDVCGVFQQLGNVGAEI